MRRTLFQSVGNNYRGFYSIQPNSQTSLAPGFNLGPTPAGLKRVFAALETVHDSIQVIKVILQKVRTDCGQDAGSNQVWIT
jgi:hypothetical protein